jgi:hypothetical protein
MSIKNYVLYLRQCPGVEVPRHFKVGIMQLSTARSRMATYQNAVGPVYVEQFVCVWVGDENQIRLAEKAFKSEFKSKIQSAEAGLSEWICDIDLQELLLFITSLRDEHFLKFVDVPQEFLPLTMPLCEDLEEWYTSTGIEILKQMQ